MSQRTWRLAPQQKALGEKPRRGAATVIGMFGIFGIFRFFRFFRNVLNVCFFVVFLICLNVLNVGDCLECFEFFDVFDVLDFLCFFSEAEGPRLVRSVSDSRVCPASLLARQRTRVW